MTRSPQPRSLKTLEIILEAAERLIAGRGLNSLTMDAVAAEAGVSKGGVLHHFRSKEALIAGLVSRKINAIRDGTALEEAALAGAPNPALLAMLRHSAREYGTRDGFPPALLVAATQNSQSADLLRLLLREKLEAIRAETDRSSEANVLVFATLGLLLSQALGFSTLTDDEAGEIFAQIELSAHKLA